MQDSTMRGRPPDTSGKRVCSKLEKMVGACKTRINELTSANVESIFCPPNMQLEFSSKSRKSRRSGRTMVLAEEIIDKELELEMFQADSKADMADRLAAHAKAEIEKMVTTARFDAEIRKKQAMIQAKKRKLELSSQSLTASSVRSSRYSF